MQYGILRKNNADSNMGFVHFAGARVFSTYFLPNIRSLSTPVARGRGGRARGLPFSTFSPAICDAPRESPLSH